MICGTESLSGYPSNPGLKLHIKGNKDEAIYLGHKLQDILILQRAVGRHICLLFGGSVARAGHKEKDTTRNKSSSMFMYSLHPGCYKFSLLNYFFSLFNTYLSNPEKIIIKQVMLLIRKILTRIILIGLDYNWNNNIPTSQLVGTIWSFH